MRVNSSAGLCGYTQMRVCIQGTASALGVHFYGLLCSSCLCSDACTCMYLCSVYVRVCTLCTGMCVCVSYVCVPPYLCMDVHMCMGTQGVHV